MSHPRSSLRGALGTYLIALAVALSSIVGAIVGVNVLYERKIDSIDRVQVEVAENTDPGEPANFLLIGSDSREFAESAEEQEAFGDEQSAGGQRSDTIMIVHVDPDARTGLLVSFPRDLLVEIPGVGRSKINAAFNEGPQKVIDTIQANFDVPIHHYLEIGFASFEGIVNAVGGVPVFFPTPARDEVSGLLIDQPFGGPTLFPGCFELFGTEALAYVRSRHYEVYVDGSWEEDPTADLGRIERQQTFMRRLAAEAVSRAVRDPLAANGIADKSLEQLKADEALSRSDVDKLIQAFRRVNPNDPRSIEMVTVPIQPAGDGANLVLDEEPAELFFTRLRQLESVDPAPSGPAPSEIRVRVFNGSGVDGAAAEASSELGEQGFQTAGIGNNAAGEVETTEVRYRAGSEDRAKVVEAYLDGDVELVEDDSIVEADVVVVLGGSFEGVTPPSGGGPPPASETAAPETATAPPSSSSGSGGGGGGGGNGGGGKGEGEPPSPEAC